MLEPRRNPRRVHGALCFEWLARPTSRITATRGLLGDVVRIGADDKNAVAVRGRPFNYKEIA